MSPRTKQNLHAAIQFETLACAKYLRFARVAGRENAPGLARLFQSAAAADRCRRLASEIDSSSLVASCAENLKQAISDKKYQMELYDHYAWEANWDNDQPAAAMFKGLKADESATLAQFERALEELTAPSDRHAEARNCATTV